MKFSIFFFLLSVAVLGQTDFENAEQLIADQQFKKAEILLLKYVKNHPNSQKGIELLGDAFAHQQNWDDAIANYKKLVESHPKTANYHYKYGGALAMKVLSISKIKALMFVNDMKQAFINAANLDPKHLETRWALVKLYMELPGVFGGSKSQALTYADELQNISKVDSYLAKGYIYEYSKAFEQAENHYKKAVEVGKSLHCFEQLTSLYEKQRQPQNAISNLENAYKIHHDNNLKYEIGRIAASYNIQQNKGLESLQAYLANYSATDKMPKAWAYYRLAQVYKQQQHTTEALIHINLAVSEMPNEALFIKEKKIILRLK